MIDCHASSGRGQRESRFSSTPAADSHRRHDRVSYPLRRPKAGRRARRGESPITLPGLGPGTDGPERGQDRSDDQATELQRNMAMELSARERPSRKWKAKLLAYSKAARAHRKESRELKLKGHSAEEVAELIGPEPIHPAFAVTPLRSLYANLPASGSQDKRLPRRDRMPSCLAACLRCKLKGLPCSLQWLGEDRAARCRRCVINGCTLCLQQAKSVEDMLRHEGLPAGERGPTDYRRQQDETPIRRDSVIRARLPGRGEAELVLFVREPGVTAAELCDLALDMVRGKAVDFGGMLGEALAPLELRELPLPSWTPTAGNEDEGEGNYSHTGEPEREPEPPWRRFFREGEGWFARHRWLIREGAQMWEDGKNPLEAAHQKLEDTTRRLWGENCPEAFALEQADEEREARLHGAEPAEHTDPDSQDLVTMPGA